MKKTLLKMSSILLFVLMASIGLYSGYAKYNTNKQIIPWSPNFSSLPETCKVQTLSTSPYILCIHDFLSDTETEHLKELAGPLLKRSLVVGTDEKEVTSQQRTSSSAFLHNVQTEITTKIRTRAANFVNTDLNNVEQLQVVHYRDGQKYEPHYDFFDRTLPSAKESIGTLGQRIATILVYLNDITSDSGGETLFPKVLDGLKIKPKKNMAVFWFNVLPDGKEDAQTLHGGMPIYDGEKWATNIWIRSPKLIG